MPDHIRELLHRNLQEVFGEGNAARRRAAIESLYTEDCVLYAPPGEAQTLHNAGRLAWGSGPRGEPPNYTGLDVVIVRDGKIAALYVFLDPVQS